MEYQLLLNALLAVATVSADSALLLVNRFTLSCKQLAPAAFNFPPLANHLRILAGTYK